MSALLMVCHLSCSFGKKNNICEWTATDTQHTYNEISWRRLSFNHLELSPEFALANIHNYWCLAFLIGCIARANQKQTYAEIKRSLMFSNSRNGMVFTIYLFVPHRSTQNTRLDPVLVRYTSISSKKSNNNPNIRLDSNMRCTRTQII